MWTYIAGAAEGPAAVSQRLDSPLPRACRGQHPYSSHSRTSLCRPQPWDQQGPATGAARRSGQQGAVFKGSCPGRRQACTMEGAPQEGHAWGPQVSKGPASPALHAPQNPTSCSWMQRSRTTRGRGPGSPAPALGSRGGSQGGGQGQVDVSTRTPALQGPGDSALCHMASPEQGGSRGEGRVGSL